jgi:hypothetical protein
MLVVVKINSNVMNNSRNRENIQASNNNNLFLLSHGCRHPSSALAYIKGTSRERRKIDEHSTDKESTKSRTGERGQGNEKRDRERGRKSNEREVAHRKTEKKQENTEGRTSILPAHHTFIINFAVSRESIDEKRKIETNTSFTSVHHCLQNQ